MRAEPLGTSLRGGWELVLRDPVGVLLPTAGLLVLQGAVVYAAQAWWGSLSTWLLVLAISGLAALRVIIGAPMRSAMLAAGARQLGRPFSVWGRAPTLAVVWLVAAAVEGLVVGGVVSTAFVPAWWLLARGTYWGVALIVFTTAPAVLLFGVIVRTTFAYVAIEATAGKRTLGQAFSEGLRLAGRDAFPAMVILIAGELALALGSLLCGAGALPALPFPELALLHRWASFEEDA